MKSKFNTALILLAISISLNTAGALPPPCSQEELLETSEFAVEGEVTKVVCGKPYDSNECSPEEGKEAGFEPELFSNCAATVLISKNLKGTHEEGTKVVIPYVRVAKECKDGNSIIPGSPTNELSTGDRIKYYKSQQCRYWNIQKLEEPSSDQK